ncbi:hypothetical protein BDN67DRAFT_971589 [Paxillus ammoniavirescens]|nr:hypothetical protein BDN67DRAFT_971589 [Paxillus ammoniavirescens]
MATSRGGRSGGEDPVEDADPAGASTPPCTSVLELLQDIRNQMSLLKTTMSTLGEEMSIMNNNVATLGKEMSAKFKTSQDTSDMLLRLVTEMKDEAQEKGHASPPKNKGPDHANKIELPPSRSAGKYVFRPGSAATVTATPPRQSPPLRRAIAPLFNLGSQYPTATPAPISQLSSARLARAPGPSSFFAPSPPSVVAPSSFTPLTTLKRKRKAESSSTGSSNNSEISSKYSSTPSAIVQAQQEGGAAMKQIAAAMQDLSRLMAPPSDDIGTAISLLNEHPELSAIDKLDIGDYLVKPENRDQVVTFRAYGFETRKVWLRRRLEELRRV